VNAQRTIINHPTYETRINPDVELNKIILSDSATILCMEFSYFQDDLIEIPSTYFIKTNTGEKLLIKSVLPSKVNETAEFDSRIHFKQDGKTIYLLVFPAISSSVLSIDLDVKDSSEGILGTPWIFLAIDLKGKN
jgi:hypothetical protein